MHSVTSTQLRLRDNSMCVITGHPAWPWPSQAQFGTLKKANVSVNISLHINSLKKNCHLILNANMHMVN